MRYPLDLRRTTYFLVTIVLIGYLLIVGKFFLQPLFFSIFFLFLFRPIVAWFEQYIPSRILAVLLTYLVVFIPVAGIGYIFTMQAVSLFPDLSAVSAKLEAGLTGLVDFFQDFIYFTTDEAFQYLRENINSIVSQSMSLLTQTIGASTAVVTSLALSLIYTFFFLLYRDAFREFFIIQFDKDHQSAVRKILWQIQSIMRRYVYGMLGVIVILAVLNSTGLWLIWIGHPLFWGVLAAMLAIIPYLGTTLGGFLPFLYAIATTGTIWQPVAVVLMYVGIQNLEGNVITPNVVGSSIKINPFVAIISLTIGGMIWGLSGLILALPIAAIVRLIFESFEPLLPLSILMSDETKGQAELLRKNYNHPQYRILKWFNNDGEEESDDEEN